MADDGDEGPIWPIILSLAGEIAVYALLAGAMLAARALLAL